MKFLADVTIPGQFGQVTETAPGSEAFVLVFLATLAFLFGAFAMAAIVLWNRSRRPAPHRRLLMELEERDDRSVAPPPPKPRPIGGEEEIRRHPWEQKADWWKE